MYSYWIRFCFMTGITRMREVRVGHDGFLIGGVRLEWRVISSPFKP